MIRLTKPDLLTVKLSQVCLGELAGTYTCTQADQRRLEYILGAVFTRGSAARCSANSRSSYARLRRSLPGTSVGTSAAAATCSGSGGGPIRCSTRRRSGPGTRLPRSRSVETARAAERRRQRRSRGASTCTAGGNPYPRRALSHAASHAASRDDLDVDDEDGGSDAAFAAQAREEKTKDD